MTGEPILIVDDTLVNLKLTRILLTTLGYQVLSAASAEEALEVLQSNHPRLVLTDIQLPGMNGLELARHIKSGLGTRDILVVALAAFAGPHEETAALESGCDGCIAKPVDMHTLGLRVRQFLARNQPSGMPGPTAAPSLNEATLRPLRDRFLEEAHAQVSRWRNALEQGFEPDPAARTAHQWIGAAGLLGYAEIGERARSLEAALRNRPIDLSELREALNALLPALAARLNEGEGPQ